MFDVERSMFNVSALAVPLERELFELVFRDQAESKVEMPELTLLVYF